MNVAVWDTYVRKEDGTVMHFDILVQDLNQHQDQILAYGRTYLEGKRLSGDLLQASRCQFCHVESASAEVLASIHKDGYHIIELQNCT